MRRQADEKSAGRRTGPGPQVHGRSEGVTPVTLVLQSTSSIVSSLPAAFLASHQPATIFAVAPTHTTSPIQREGLPSSQARVRNPTESIPYRKKRGADQGRLVFHGVREPSGSSKMMTAKQERN